MRAYQDIIWEMLKGETPKEKHDYLLRLKEILTEIAYPRRGTGEESKSLLDFAQEIIKEDLVK